ncbi:MAG: CPBP family intramembrane glutamic endopeptidase [Phototrophicaceae bacterium]
MKAESKRNSLVSVYIIVLFSIVAWTLYVLLMAAFPNPFANDHLRAIARVLIVLLPALFHIFRQQNISKIDYLQLRQNCLRGIVVGLTISGIYLAYIIKTTMTDPIIAVPSDASIWFNFIIGSPLAEELLFRGVLFNELNRSTTSYWAIGISALMFAILHLPVWIILDGMPFALLMNSFISIFIYGLVFAMMMKFTKSLWTPLAAHWLNNLILLSVVDSIIN